MSSPSKSSLLEELLWSGEWRSLRFKTIQEWAPNLPPFLEPGTSKSMFESRENNCIEAHVVLA
jgi:hypothetical protein